MKRTSLFERHRALGGRLVPFAGWEMPVQYSGLMEEHLCVRESCGIFDVSHMGEIEITGPHALKAVQYLGTNDITKVGDGQCQYTLLCYPAGGVVDDCIVYRYSPERFMICVNASNTEKVFKWFKEVDLSEVAPDVTIRDVSEDYCQIALQGPSSAAVLKKLINTGPGSIKGFYFIETELRGRKVLISRTGYTGEDGFEIYSSPHDGPAIWEAVMEAGKEEKILPIGLGARNTLRLEMGYPLYGHELSEDISPVEAGLMRFVGLDKEAFMGHEAIKAQAGEGVEKTLAGFVLEGPGVPRDNYKVKINGAEAGFVTSGTLSPSLK
ncbi:MAG: glycine cleavage system aminomethyltransferase GcvT, partial [Thermodesulfobacteriota bacterium]